LEIYSVRKVSYLLSSIILSGFAFVALGQSRQGDVQDGRLNPQELLRKAMQYTQEVPDKIERSIAVINVASLQASIGEIDAARLALNLVDDDEFRGGILDSIVSAQAEAGDFDAAKKTLELIPQDRDREIEWAKRSIALEQAKRGNLEEALRAANALGEGHGDTQLLTDIAVHLMNSKDNSTALSIFNKAVFVAHNEIEPASRNHLIFGVADTIGGIAEARAQAGDSSGAVKDIMNLHDELERIDDSDDRVTALYYLGCAQVNVGDIAGAIMTADEVESSKFLGVNDTFPCNPTPLRIRILEAQIHAKDMSGALLNLARISDPYEKIIALCYLSGDEFRSGKKEEANRMLVEAYQMVPRVEHSWERPEALEEIGHMRELIGDTANAKSILEEAKKGPGGNESDWMSDSEAQRRFQTCLAANDLDGAIRANTRVPDTNVQDFLYRKMGADSVKSGNSDQAFQMLEKEIPPLKKVQVLLGMVDGILEWKQN
jgi:hypothetical protein